MVMTDLLMVMTDLLMVMTYPLMVMTYILTPRRGSRQAQDVRAATPERAKLG